MFGFFDKRLRYLKKQSRHPLAARAIKLYADDGSRNYCYFCGATGSNENDWEAFKTWVINWVSQGGLDNNNLLTAYLQWVENERFIDENTKKKIEAFWSHGAPPAFNKKDNTSGQFFIFAAFVESQFIKKVKS